MVLSLRATATLFGLGSKANSKPLPSYHIPEDLRNSNKTLSRTAGEIARERALWYEEEHNPPEPAKSPPSSSLWTHMRRDGDGVWQCHRCHQQNLLNQSLHAHPFGQLKCRCKHVWCSNCTTSDILRPLYTDVTDPVFLEKLESSANGRICRKCGLTWRGQRYYCTCGSESWRGFIVGSSKDYREGNPDAVFGRALEQKIGVMKAKSK
jgi:hypothetical protein